MSAGPANHPPRVMMVIGQFWPTRGGAENQALGLASELVARGCEVSVLTLALRGHASESIRNDVRILRRIRPWPLGPLWGWTYHRQVVSELRARAADFDLAHCHQLYIHTSAAVAAGLGKPVVCKIVCGGAWSDFKRLERTRGGRGWLARALEADRLIALNDDLEREIAAEGYPEGRIELIPNMVDTERFCPPEQRRAEEEIVFIGRLDPQKNLPLLIEAYARLAPGRPGLRLTILGDRDDRFAPLADLCKRLGVADGVIFEGWRDEVELDLKRATLVATASRAEGQSNLLLEALASGAPCVASAASGNRELMGCEAASGGDFTIGSRGVLVEKESAGAFAAALEKLLADPDKRASMGAQGRRFATQRFSVDRVVDRYLRLYAELLDSPSENRSP